MPRSQPQSAHRTLHRRQWLGTISGGLAGAGLAPLAAAVEPAVKPPAPGGKFRFALNTSTLRGQKLPLDEIVDIAAKVGYDGVEPWLQEIERYVEAGGSLADLRKRIADHGLVVASAIAFPEWVVDDDQRRAKGFEAARRAMDLVAQIGGQRIAAPPAGATKGEQVNLVKAAERYRALLEAGERIGVAPELEFWGFSSTLGRLSEAAFVAIEARHPKACILADIYHLYKGGSGYEGLRMLSAETLPVVHLNDYPLKPPRAEITDAQRVFPGDGAAPLKDIFRSLRSIGFDGYLSLELFNPGYWGRDATEVARIGLEKSRAIVLDSQAAPG